MEADTIRSIMILAAGVLTFSGAVLTVVNNRLQAASTPEAKERFVVNLLSGIEAVLWVLGLAGSVAFNSIAVALWFITPAFVMHCIAFLRGRGGSLRLDVLMLVLSATFVVLIICLYLLMKLADLIEKLVNRLVA